MCSRWHSFARYLASCRRERSSEFLRMKSIQMHKAQQQRERQQTAAAAHKPAMPPAPGEALTYGSPYGTPRVMRPSAGTAPIPVLSMEVVNSLEAYFPAGSPVVHLLKAPAAFPATEADHLANKGRYEDGADILGVSLPSLRRPNPRRTCQLKDFLASICGSRFIVKRLQHCKAAKMRKSTKKCRDAEAHGALSRQHC